MNFDEDSRNDYFDGPDIEEKPIPPKEPELRPDDPRYWEEPEDEFEHITGRAGRAGRNWRLWLWVAAAGVMVGILWAFYIYIFSPKIVAAPQYGYVEHIEKHQGMVFDTYEGVLLPYKSLMDTVRPYEGDFRFSVRNPSVAATLKRMQFANRPIRIIYDVYRSHMPWRGECEYIVTRVDTVREQDILPPDRQPSYLKSNTDE